MIALTHAFGFSADPFGQDVPVDKLYPLPGLEPFVNRFDFAVPLGLSTVITGEVGSGKSTSLRFAASRLHPAEYRILFLIATTGTILELLRQICLSFGVPPQSNSSARLFHTIRDLLADVRAKKQTPLLFIDEAHLLRTEVFAQLHTLIQAPFDSASILPLVLSGQTSLLDKLLFHTSRPFASRLVGRTHLEGLQSQQDMQNYLVHHLKIVGCSKDLFSPEAVTSIHQSSGGLLRRAGNLARGALLAAAQESCQVVSAEHVRIAASEIL
jgi:general secretion pathway protein A